MSETIKEGRSKWAYNDDKPSSHAKGQGLLRSPGQTGRPAPRRRLRLPTLVGEVGLPAEGHDPSVQEVARAVRPGGGLGLGGP